MSARLIPVAFAAALGMGLGGCFPSFSVDDPSSPVDPNHPSDPNNPNQPVDDAGVPIVYDLTPAPDLAIDPVAEFNAKVAPILETSCAGCHNKTGGIGPGFLEPHPDILTTLLSYPGMIGSTPDTSRIYAKGVHEGPGLTAVDKPIVGDWISLWARLKPKAEDGGTAKPTVMPFAPTMGANTIDLSVLETSLAGQKITFTASMVGTTLHLSNIMIVAVGQGLHMAHPLWVTWDANMVPTPDPVDSFSNLDETVAGGQSQPMGPGTLFLPNFASTMMLNVVFMTIESKGGNADGGGGGTLGCKNVMSWTSAAKPALSNSCVSCHGGNNASATGALPLRAADSDTVNCANTLGEVDTATPANSRLYSFPNPNNGGNGHPFHFPDAATFQAFTTAVNPWIANEK